MENIYSKIDPDLLLHLIYEFSDFESGRYDVVDENQFLQVSALQMENGKTFKPHKHIWKRGENECITQESWVVLQGKVEVSFFDINGDLLCKRILNQGDCSITLQGGHTYESLIDNTKVLEYKTGPYKGQKLDKVFLDD